jgi:hypothetical protein
LPQPADQINGFTATLSRKLLTFLIARASIAFGVCSPAFATQALDGANQAIANTGSTGTGLVSVALTTTQSNDVIISLVQGPSSASTGFSLSGTGLRRFLSAGRIKLDLAPVFLFLRQ